MFETLKRLYDEGKIGNDKLENAVKMGLINVNDKEIIVKEGKK